MLLRLVLGIGVSLLAAARVSAQTAQSVDEYRLKAAFLYNFAKFVEWPREAWPGPADPLAICILGKNPLTDALAQVVEGNTVQGRSLYVRGVSDTGAAAHCHILFISDSERSRISAILAMVRGRGILTIGESPGFAERGVVINFKIDHQHVRFEINLAAADEQKLTISSKLLRLAEVLRK